MTTFTVYTVRDELMRVRYVGCTSMRPEDRLRSLRVGKQSVGKWIRDEITANRSVYIVPEETHEPDEDDELGLGYTRASARAYEAEREYIQGYYRLIGDRLLNRTNVPSPRSKVDPLLAVSDINGLLHKESA